MKGGKRVPNCVPKNEEDELERTWSCRHETTGKKACHMPPRQWQSMVRPPRWAYLPQRLIREETHQQGQSNEEICNSINSTYMLIIMCIIRQDYRAIDTEVATPPTSRRY